MNKILLLGAAGILSFGANAQSLKRTVSPSTPMDAQASKLAPAYAETLYRTVNGTTPIGAYKTAAAPFWSDDFSSGTPTSLPSGWTAAGNSAFPATWKWTNRAATSQFNIGALQSTTASNGWMIYDSDSIGSLNASATPQEGWLTSPAINCSGKSSVILTFEQHFRRFKDSCFVEVSANNFATFTRYEVLPNMSINSNDYAGPNPTKTRVNISTAAANQPNVKFRFHYIGVELGGAYNWLVDDVALSEADPIDVSIDNSSLVMRGRNRYTLASSYPRVLVDTTWGITFADNDGATAVTPDFTYNVTRSGAAVYNYSRQIALPIASVDSLIDFSEPFPGFLPNVSGTYQAIFKATVAGDATPGNNVDTTMMVISDSTLAVFNPGASLSGYYVHRPSSHSAGEATFFQGMQFEISKDKSDTVTSASASFSSSTQPGGKVSIQIYKRIGGGYSIVGSSVALPLTSTMISPAGSATFATFPIDNSNGPVVLDSGSYVAVVQTESVPANNSVVLWATPSLNPNAVPFVGYPGAQGTSNNDGAFDFSPNSLAVGTTRAAVMRVNFGTVPSSVKNTVSNFELGAARPNPAQSEFSVPVTLKAAAEVSVTLTNPMGQVVATQNLGKVAAGQTTTAVFNTSALANGVYFYTVEAGGARTTNRVVVAH